MNQTVVVTNTTATQATTQAPTLTNTPAPTATTAPTSVPADIPTQPPAVAEEADLGPPQLTDEQLLAAAYGPKTEPNVGAAGFAYHVNTISVVPLSSRVNYWVDLCTDDLQTARSWAADTLAYSSDAGQVEPGMETESSRFFDFPFRPMSGNTRVMRAYKCSYFQPILNRLSTEWTYGSPSDVLLGKLTSRVTNDGSREFAEYSWFEQMHEMHGENWLTTNVYQSDSQIFVDVFNTTLTRETSGSVIVLEL